MLIKTYESLDSTFPVHTRTLFIIYDNFKVIITDERHQVIIVGNLPIEISFLMNSFMKSREGTL